jgi:hypothetical protein
MSNSSRIYKKAELCCSRDQPLRSFVLSIEKFVGRALDDTTSDGKLAAKAGEEGIDITSALASFIDTPMWC